MSSADQLMNNLKSGKLSLEESVLAERATYRAGRDAFFKEKNYDKADALQKKYEVMRDVNHEFKISQEAKALKTDWSKVKSNPGGPSVRNDDSAGGRRDLTSDFAKRMKKMRDQGA